MSSRSVVSFLMTRCKYSIFSLLLHVAFEMVILTFFALSANFKDDKLSSSVPSSDEQFTINDVLNRPERESFNNLVSLESLNGIWSFFFRVIKAFMTLPRHDKE